MPKTKRPLYADIANRVTAAVTELNEALVEASRHPQVRVHMGPSQATDLPLQFGCEVTRITKHVITPVRNDKDMKWLEYVVTHPGGKKEWKLKAEIKTAISARSKK